MIFAISGKCHPYHSYKIKNSSGTLAKEAEIWPLTLTRIEYMLISLSRSSSSAIACTIIVSTLSGENFSLNLRHNLVIIWGKEAAVHLPGKGVTETQAHCCQIFRVESIQKSSKLAPNTPPYFGMLWRDSSHIDAKFF